MTSLSLMDSIIPMISPDVRASSFSRNMFLTIPNL